MGSFHVDLLEMLEQLTGHNVPGVHGILVLDEAESIHKLDLSDLTGTVSCEVSLDIGLGRCTRSTVSPSAKDRFHPGSKKASHPKRALRLPHSPSRIYRGGHTITRKIAQVEPGRRHFSSHFGLNQTPQCKLRDSERASAGDTNGGRVSVSPPEAQLYTIPVTV